MYIEIEREKLARSIANLQLSPCASATIITISSIITIATITIINNSIIIDPNCYLN